MVAVLTLVLTCIVATNMYSVCPNLRILGSDAVSVRNCVELNVIIKPCCGGIGC